MKKTTILVWIFVGILIITSIAILVAQFLSSRDLFSPASIRENTTKVVNQDTVVTVNNISAQVLIPAGFSSDFSNRNGNAVIGYISNPDVDIVVRYQATETATLEQSTGGSDSSQEIIERAVFDSNYINITDQIYRSKLLENSLPTTYVYLTDTSFLEDESIVYVVGQNNLPILKRTAAVGDGVSIEIFVRNTDLNESQRTSYLQLADKVLLSIQGNE